MKEPPPREAGLLVVARARLSADGHTIENVEVLLNAEGRAGASFRLQMLLERTGS
jgi:hypothetical protein